MAILASGIQQTEKRGEVVMFNYNGSYEKSFDESGLTIEIKLKRKIVKREGAVGISSCEAGGHHCC